MPPRAVPSVRHLTPAELGERLGMSTETLRDWRRGGRGPAYIRDVGAGDKAFIRYPLAEVEAWEKSRLIVRAST